MKYLEIKETLSSEERLPQLIRIEVKDETEAKAKARELQDLITGEKKSFIHEHYHNADPALNEPCVTRELDLTIKAVEDDKSTEEGI